jgi:hypothetical protein
VGVGERRKSMEVGVAVTALPPPVMGISFCGFSARAKIDK